ncbi:hypothetical protein AB0K71_25785 [Streptomyces syringium]|uniref:hypothetical protein n=1 Tax=Streptomyces syringium TaxID=76729 RepID=UPI003419386E
MDPEPLHRPVAAGGARSDISHMMVCGVSGWAALPGPVRIVGVLDDDALIGGQGTRRRVLRAKGVPLLLLRIGHEAFVSFHSLHGGAGRDA